MKLIEIKTGPLKKGLVLVATLALLTMGVASSVFASSASAVDTSGMPPDIAAACATATPAHGTYTSAVGSDGWTTVTWVPDAGYIFCTFAVTTTSSDGTVVQTASGVNLGDGSNASFEAGPGLSIHVTSLTFALATPPAKTVSVVAPVIAYKATCDADGNSSPGRVDLAVEANVTHNVTLPDNSSIVMDFGAISLQGGETLKFTDVADAGYTLVDYPANGWSITMTYDTPDGKCPTTTTTPTPTTTTTPPPVTTTTTPPVTTTTTPPPVTTTTPPVVKTTTKPPVKTTTTTPPVKTTPPVVKTTTTPPVKTTTGVNPLPTSGHAGQADTNGQLAAAGLAGGAALLLTTAGIIFYRRQRSEA